MLDDMKAADRAARKGGTDGAASRPTLHAADLVAMRTDIARRYAAFAARDITAEIAQHFRGIQPGRWCLGIERSIEASDLPFDMRAQLRPQPPGMVKGTLKKCGWRHRDAGPLRATQ
jgi:hypothetical protein